MFEAMLERYPTDQARVELWFGCAPSKSKTYMGIQDNVDRLVRRVHDAYGSAFRHFPKDSPRRNCWSPWETRTFASYLPTGTG